MTMTGQATMRQRTTPAGLHAVVAVLAVLAAIGACRRETASGSAGAAVAMAAGPAGASVDGGTFEVESASDGVEAQRGGRWFSIKRGDRLTRSDVVRTSASSSAVLRLAAGTEIELRAGVEIGLDRLPGGPSVDLRRGRVLARVGGTDTLALTARDTRTTNEGPARFVVRADDQGRVSVAALEGKARFSAAGKTVALEPGTTSSSSNGGPPEDPERIPEEVLLNVVWPSAEHHGAEAEVAGRTAPSSTISINGAPASVGTDGRFSAKVPLREGKNVMHVDAEDLTGRTRRDEATLVRRTAHPPKLTPEAADLWKK
jgi:hypothetical protein